MGEQESTWLHVVMRKMTATPDDRDTDARCDGNEVHTRGLEKSDGRFFFFLSNVLSTARDDVRVHVRSLGMYVSKIGLWRKN